MEGITRVAGLDLSVKRIGYADPDGGIHSITPRAGAKDPARRLHELVRDLEALIGRFPPAPDLIVIEGYSLGSPGRISLIRLGEIGGCVRLRLFERQIRYVEIPPASLKLFATGNGAATKEDMVDAAHILGARGGRLGGVMVNHDEADAFHARRMGLVATSGEPVGEHERRAYEKAGVEW